MSSSTICRPPGARVLWREDGAGMYEHVTWRRAPGAFVLVRGSCGDHACVRECMCVLIQGLRDEGTEQACAPPHSTPPHITQGPAGSGSTHTHEASHTWRAAMRAARCMRPMQSAPVKPAIARATSYQLMEGSTALLRACTCGHLRVGTGAGAQQAGEAAAAPRAPPHTRFMGGPTALLRACTCVVSSTPGFRAGVWSQASRAIPGPGQPRLTTRLSWLLASSPRTKPGRTDLHDLGAPDRVRQRHVDDAVKAAGPDERRVDGGRAVGGAQHHDAAVVLKAVHLHLCVCACGCACECVCW